MAKGTLPFRLDPGDRAVQAAKQGLRQDFLFARTLLDQDLRATTQWKLINHLRSIYEQIGPAVTAVYLPRGKEVDLTPWVRELWAQGITVLLPRVVERGHPLAFNVWYPQDPLTEIDRLGLRCAQGPELLPRVVVIPCLGYNRQGYRLGYGGGYYDRTLKALDIPVQTIGVCYTAHEIPEFPRQYHDQRLDYVVTGKEVIHCL